MVLSRGFLLYLDFVAPYLQYSERRPELSSQDAQVESSLKKRSDYVPAYHGLRCFLLLAVLEAHYMLHRVPIEKIWVLAHALPCFFAMSGFLITEALLKSKGSDRGLTLLKFYLRRGLRIFPAYYFILGVAALTVGIPYLGWYLAHLLNFKIFWITAYGTPEQYQSYFLNWESNGIHLWTTSIEAQFYLLYPPLLLFGSERWRTRLLVTGIGLCIAIRIFYIVTFPGIYYGALTPIPGEYILWGCLFAWLDFQGKIPFWRTHKALALVAALFLILCAMENNPGRYTHGIMRPNVMMTGFAVCFSVLVLVLRYQREAWYSKILSWKPFVFVGKVSYSTYLVHLFLNPLVDKLLLLFPFMAISAVAPRVLLGPLVSIAAATLIWYTFESPLNQLKNPLSRKIDEWAQSRKAAGS